MKKIIILLTLILFTSCTDERENEYFNPQYQIKVNFDKNKAWESGRELEKTKDLESHICDKIIKGQPIPDNVKFSALCSGGNDKGLNYSYVIISGDVNGYFLIVYKDNCLLSFKLPSYNSTECLKKWITETN